nr:P0 protein [Lily-associated polerovirus 1]
MRFEIPPFENRLIVYSPGKLPFLKKAVAVARFLEFLPNYIYCNDGTSETLVRSVLCVLPLLLSQCLHLGPRVALGRAKQLLFLRFALLCGHTPAVAGGHIDLLMPPSRAAFQSELLRIRISAMAQALQRYQHVFQRGRRWFLCFVRTWLAYSQRECRRDFGKLVVAPSVLLDLRRLGHLVLNTAIHLEVQDFKSLHRLFVRLNKIYGESGAVAFWRIAGLPFQRNFQTPEMVFWKSALQRVLAGEGN